MTLPDDVRQRGLDAVQVFFRDARDEAIGDLQAGFLLDAVVAAVGPALFARGVRAAQTHLHAVVADLDVSIVPPEAPRRR